MYKQFYTAVSPIGSRVGTAEQFFKAYLALFVVAAFWIAGYFWKRTGWLRTAQMDVDTGRRELDWDLINREREEMKTWPAWKRVMARVF
jgi:amino acid transporter